MKCKTIHNKLIFFLEGNLSKEEMEVISDHLQKCETCLSFANDMKLTLSVIDSEKSPKVNPYFYSRVKARLENQVTEKKVTALQHYLRILQPVAFSVLLVIGIYLGIKIGQVPQQYNTYQLLSEHEMIPFLNEMRNEPIETFLMEQ